MVNSTPLELRVGDRNDAHFETVNELAAATLGIDVLNVPQIKKVLLVKESISHNPELGSHSVQLGFVFRLPCAHEFPDILARYLLLAMWFAEDEAAQARGIFPTERENLQSQGLIIITLGAGIMITTTRTGSSRGNPAEGPAAVGAVARLARTGRSVVVIFDGTRRLLVGKARIVLLHNGILVSQYILTSSEIGKLTRQIEMVGCY